MFNLDTRLEKKENQLQLDPEKGNTNNGAITKETQIITKETQIMRPFAVEK